MGDFKLAAERFPDRMRYIGKVGASGVGPGAVMLVSRCQWFAHWKRLLILMR
jgi:hypothetical protein